MDNRLLSGSILIAYAVALIAILVFKANLSLDIGQLQFEFSPYWREGNLVPFRTISSFLGDFGLSSAINLVGNIVLLIPIGFLVPIVYRSMTGWKSLASAVTIGLALEVAQASLRVGIFDVDDIMLNAFGVIVGYWAFIEFVALAQPVIPLSSLMSCMNRTSAAESGTRQSVPPRRLKARANPRPARRG